MSYIVSGKGNHFIYGQIDPKMVNPISQIFVGILNYIYKKGQSGALSFRYARGSGKSRSTRV